MGVLDVMVDMVLDVVAVDVDVVEPVPLDVLVVNNREVACSTRE